MIHSCKPVRIIGIVSILISIMCTDIHAQPRTTLTGAPNVTVQDTNSIGQDVQLNELLETSLQSLSDKARRDRRISGYLLLGLGIGSGIGGVATVIRGGSDNVRIVGYSLLGGAALFSSLSLIPFNLPSESERIYDELGRMPTDSPGQVRQRYIYGDRRFEELARKERRGRFINGSASVVVGITSILLADRDQEQYLVWPLFGVTQLLFRSEAERRYETYRRTKEDLMTHNGNSKVQYGLLLIPTGGLVGTVHVQF